MRTWLRVLLAIVGAIVCAIVATIAEVSCISVLGHDAQGQPIDGTGLVAFGLMPFAAIAGAVLGVWLVLRLTRKRASLTR